MSQALREEEPPDFEKELDLKLEALARKHRLYAKPAATLTQLEDSSSSTLKSESLEAPDSKLLELKFAALLKQYSDYEAKCNENKSIMVRLFGLSVSPEVQAK